MIQDIQYNEQMFVTMWLLFLVGSPIYSVPVPLFLAVGTVFLDIVSMLLIALVAMTYLEPGESFSVNEMSDEP